MKKNIFIEKLKNNTFSFAFTLLLGGALTAITFVTTSPPATPEEIKEELLSISKRELARRDGANFEVLTVNKLFSDELDIGPEKTIFLVGTAKSKEKIVRFISIFENSDQNIFDRMVGRSGIFRIRSMTSFEAPYDETLVPSNIESIDFNNDGVSEVIVELTSTWADSRSVGPIIYSKSISGAWSLLSLPSISDTINATPPNPDSLGRKPFNFFGMAGGNEEQEFPSIINLKAHGVSEESLMVNHNGENIEFTMFRNGGGYFHTSHSVKGYSQIQTLSFFIDEGAVLEPHFAVVNMFRFDSSKLVVDELWNWGVPIYSSRPLRLLEIDPESISKAGIQAHVIGDVFYGYTDFEKLRL